MSLESREPAAAESYPTFWTDDAPAPAPPPVPVPATEAYSTFVDLAEDDLPEVATPDAT